MVPNPIIEKIPGPSDLLHIFQDPFSHFIQRIRGVCGYKHKNHNVLQWYAQRNEIPFLGMPPLTPEMYP